MRILEIMVCLKRWLYGLSLFQLKFGDPQDFSSLCIIVTTLLTEIWMISPTRIVCL
jgi:hypothetical protein